MRESAYLLQALLVSLWWVGLLTSKSFFAAFQFEDLSPTAFMAFLAPDLIIIAGLSILRCYRNLRLLEWTILGGFAYATLYCLTLTCISGSGYLPSGLMILGTLYNALLCSEKTFFRTANSGFCCNAAKTLIQIACIWSLTLILIPILILHAFEQPLTPSLSFRSLAIVLFAAFSVLGLASAFFMVRDGAGTPIPLDQTNRLVISGPYSIVRNPMAIAGIGQGLCVAIFFQSLHLVVYALLGAIVWHVLVRPIEERDLESRFGEAFIQYRNSVRCWLPIKRGHSGL